MTGGKWDLYAVAAVCVVVGVLVAWQVVEIIDRGLAYTAGALVALGVILLAGWLAYRGGRRLGDWTADRLGFRDRKPEADWDE
jgi:hypothetical protein